ncbi:aldehyde dehydrogenase family protein [uncultured Jatrophihabitans sp.]|uniref:aldehyde dehydrogenase family protein n=1 Tax=uncultured Jatrophihabitans sp. TaxID=1610747 RepID=UPI0035C9B7D4
MVEVRNLIDGVWAEGSADNRLDVVDPATETVLTSFRASSLADVDRAVAAARRAAPGWAALPYGDRARLLHRLADAVAADLPRLQELEVADVGKPVSAVSEDELPLVLDSIRYFASAARSLSAQTTGEYAVGVTTTFRREPLGVVAAITPWNYPLWMAVWKVVPALATGNTMVLKPAEDTPLSTTRLVELAADILPPGVLNLVHGSGQTTGKHLAEHAGVDLVSFTGSVATGRAIAEGASRKPRKSVLELGGNAPVIILDDADLAAAAAKVSVMGTYNAGQECMAATRVIVAESVADAFVDRLVTELGSVVVGDPADPQTTLGPLISERQLRRVEGLIERRPGHAKVVLGGHRVPRPGFYFEPTVVTGLLQEDELVQEEIFGPVITVQTFSTAAEALELANGVPFGLSGSVWTADIAQGLRLLNGLDFGNVWLNTHLVVGPDYPLGGFNESGYGKEGGVAGIEEYTRLKAIGIQTGIQTGTVTD